VLKNYVFFLLGQLKEWIDDAQKGRRLERRRKEYRERGERKMFSYHGSVVVVVVGSRYVSVVGRLVRDSVAR
jgi:hypothetical protein